MLAGSLSFKCNDDVQVDLMFYNLILQPSSVLIPASSDRPVPAPVPELRSRSEDSDLLGRIETDGAPTEGEIERQRIIRPRKLYKSVNIQCSVYGGCCLVC